MSCCTALEYLIPQAALLSIRVNSEDPQYSAELNKRVPRPKKDSEFFGISEPEFSVWGQIWRGHVSTSRMALLILGEQRHIRSWCSCCVLHFHFISERAKLSSNALPVKHFSFQLCLVYLLHWGCFFFYISPELLKYFYLSFFIFLLTIPSCSGY